MIGQAFSPWAFLKADIEFEHFRANAREGIMRAVGANPRFAPLRDAFSFYVDDRDRHRVQVFFGKRSMFRSAPGGNLAVEGGLTLLYTLAGNGAVAVILYPAASDIASPLEDHLFLAVRRLTGHELLSRLEQDLRYLIAYGHVTSIDAHPTLAERLTIWWLRRSQPKQVQGSYTASELSQAAGKIAGSFGGSLLGAVLRPLVWIAVGATLVAVGWPHLAEWLK